MIKRMSRGEKAYQTTITIVIALIAVSSLFPLIYVISTSLVTQKEYVDRGGLIFIPHDPTLETYRQLIAQPHFFTAFMMSAIRTAAGTVLMLTLTVIAAYTLSRQDIPGRKALVWGVLITILFSAGLIPNYLVVQQLGLTDTFWALIVPGAIDSWSVLVLKQFFANVPYEIEESAVMDGATQAQMMIRIMIPLGMPALAALGMFAAVGHWNAWFDAFIYINDAKLHPLQLYIHNLFASASPTGLIRGNLSIDPSHRVSDETMKMALVVSGTIPILCVYPFLQKYFTKGMYLGAVKG